LALFSWAVLKLPFFENTGLKPQIIGLSFALKLLGAFAIYFIYSHYYTDRASADIFKYYDDAVEIYQHPNWQIKHFPDLFIQSNQRSEPITSILSNTLHWDQASNILPNDNRLMIAFNLLLLYLSQGFYLFHLLIFAALSFIGMIGLFHFFKSLTRLPPKLLLAIMILPPSTILWTSGILKESLFFFGFGMMLYHLSSLKQAGTKWHNWTFFILLLAICFWIKSYFIICFLPALLLFLLKDRVHFKLNISLTALILIATLLSFWPQIHHSLSNELSQFTELAIDTKANTYFPIQQYKGILDFLLRIPESLYNVWIKPILMWDYGALSLVNAIESGVYLLMPFFLIGFRKKSIENWVLVSMLFSFIILSSLLIGSSIPVMGAILRYRSPLLPFYILLFFTFVDISKLKHSLIRHENKKP